MPLIDRYNAFILAAKGKNGKYVKAVDHFNEVSQLRDELKNKLNIKADAISRLKEKNDDYYKQLRNSSMTIARLRTKLSGLTVCSFIAVGVAVCLFVLLSF